MAAITCAWNWLVEHCVTSVVELVVDVVPVVVPAVVPVDVPVVAPEVVLAATGVVLTGSAALPPPQPDISTAALASRLPRQNLRSGAAACNGGCDGVTACLDMSARAGEGPGPVASADGMICSFWMRGRSRVFACSRGAWVSRVVIKNERSDKLCALTWRGVFTILHRSGVLATSGCDAAPAGVADCGA